MPRTSPIPLDEFELSITDPMAARFLPPAAYTSEEFFRFELEAIWERDWICVGRLEEVGEPGDYFSIEVAGEPLVIVRADDHEVIALSAVCRHRGMLVAQGKGNCAKSFVCPYHHWAYDRRGRLIGAPQMQGVGTFDKSEIALPRVRTEVWRGFIFVNFDDHAEPLAPRLAPLEPVVAPYRPEDLCGEFLRDPNYYMYSDFDWNWKVYMDGQTECYHCDKLHATTPCMINMDLPGTRVGVTDADAGLFDYFMNGRSIDATLNHVGRAIFPPIDGLTEEQRWETHSVLVAPSLFLQLLPDSVIAVCWTPTGCSSMRSKRHRLYPQTTLDRDDFVELHNEESKAVREFVEQDLFAFAGVQRGLNSRFAPRGPISSRERVMVEFNRWLVNRYRAADERARSNGRVVTAG